MSNISKLKTEKTNLYEIAKAKNIEIDYADLQKNKALSVEVKGRDYIALSNNIKNSKDERSALAHELGHCITGSFYFVGASKIDRCRAEYKATKWALLNCVPKYELIELLKAGLNKWEIADYFNVNEDLVSLAFTYYFDYGISV